MSTVAFLGCGGVTFYLTTVAIVFSVLLRDDLHPRPFDRALWHDPAWRSSISIETRFHSIRQRMVDDLLVGPLHAGVRRSEVRALLGPKDEDPSYREPDPSAWIYYLGIGRGPFEIDGESLIVTFGADGMVTRAFLAEG